jgi:acyl-CoA synthetase (AMP-forming)/AMP-acid ligase II
MELSHPDAILFGARWLDWLDDIEATRACRKIQIRDGRTDGAASIEPHDGADAAALIQFSSGTTSAPRGIRLTHANIVANSRAIVDAFGLSPETRGVSWLPLHHDMGLVGHVLVPMWIGCTSTLMNPLHFIQKPLSWLRLVTEEKATITSAPNFACEMCIAAAARGCDGLDLSLLETLVCGGETVLPETVRSFIRTFEVHGFAPHAFAPSYGLAEATLLVTTGKNASGPRSRPLLGTASGEVTDLGPPVAGTCVWIEDQHGSRVDDGTIGEIIVSGDSVGTDLDRADAPTVVRTGDLGFLDGGRLAVVGRKKELIIVRGQNLFPVTIEEAAMRADAAIAPGGVAAIGIDREGTQLLAVFCEASRQQLRAGDQGALERKIGAGIAGQTGVVPDWVLVVGPATLPRTPSGKLRRRAMATLAARWAGNDKQALREMIIGQDWANALD